MFAYDTQRNKMHRLPCRYVKPDATDKYGSPRYSITDTVRAASRIVTMLNSWSCAACHAYITIEEVTGS